VEPIASYNHLCMSFVHRCGLLLMVFMVLHIFIVGDFGCVYMCGLDCC